MSDDLVTRLRLQSKALKLHRFGDIMDDWYGEAADEIERLLLEVDKWQKIAGNLYDEMRVRGAECVYRHEDATKDCVKDFELADETVNP